MADLIRKRLISYVVEISPPSLDSPRGLTAAPAPEPGDSHRYEIIEPPCALSECSRRVMDFRITKRKQPSRRSSAPRREGQRDGKTYRGQLGTRGRKRPRNTSEEPRTNKEHGTDSRLKSEEAKNSGGQLLEVKQARKKSRSHPIPQQNGAEVPEGKNTGKSYRHVLLRGRN